MTLLKTRIFCVSSNIKKKADRLPGPVLPPLANPAGAATNPVPAAAVKSTKNAAEELNKDDTETWEREKCWSVDFKAFSQNIVLWVDE
jgi:hypothetical protein